MFLLNFGRLGIDQFGSQTIDTHAIHINSQYKLRLKTTMRLPSRYLVKKIGKVTVPSQYSVKTGVKKVVVKKIQSQYMIKRCTRWSIR
jgi:hypothetical protein